MFVANDIITADLLNETNNVEVSNGSTSCNGGSGSWQSWDGYWYSNVDTGEEMGWIGAQGGWNVFNFGGLILLYINMKTEIGFKKQGRMDILVMVILMQINT